MVKEVAKDWRKLLSLLLIIALLVQVSPIQAFADRQDETAVQETVGVKSPGSKTVDYVTVSCCYYKNENRARFDRIQVNIDETGTSYTYDDDGNLISAKDNAGRNESYSYNNASDMTKLTTADNKAYSFTYSSTYKHRMLSATSESSNVKNSFAYDDSGNLTVTRVQSADGKSKYIRQVSEYTKDDNYLATSYSDWGFATTYDYDSYKGTLKSVTDARGNETKYTYDANTDRMKTVTSGGSKVTYTYNDNGQLTSIKSPGSSPTYSFTYDKWGNNTEVSVGSQTLVTNTYAANNGLLKTQKYGNDFTVGHGYDTLDRETSRSYNGKVKFYWAYNADGNLARYTETGGRVLTYIYDNIGRLLQVSGDDGSYVKTSYDKLDKSTRLRYKFNGQRRDIYFDYSSKDNLPLRVKFGTNSAYAVENSYDDLTRLSGKTYTVAGNNEKLKTAYTYKDLDSNAERTTGTVKGIDYTYVEGGLTTYNRWYDYDGIGNIVAEYERKDGKITARERYVYDAKNQLVRHNSATQKCTITYSYDAGGNITAKNIYAYTIAESLEDKTPTETIVYTYGNDAWKDELTSYNGEAIEYDAIGNPTAYRGWTMTWQGRQLTKAVNGDNTLSFTYDSEGIRTSKSDGTNTTKYLLNGTQILAQTTNGKTLSFFYDQQGNRVAMADSSNHIYYYLYNLQGDVIALADASTGKLAATYTYDAWGKIVKINNQAPEAVAETSIAKINPFRYRGYYYDTETKLYYLQTRYYDPEVGRFINADAFASTDISSPLSANMFAYCENRPTVGSDPTGEWVHIAVGAIVGGIVGGIEAAYNGENVLSKVLTGAVGGALSMSGAGLAAQIAGAAALAAVDNTVKQLTSAPASSFSVDSLISDTISGGISGAIGGKGASYTNAKSIMGYGQQVVKQVGSNIKHGKSVFKPIKNYLGRAHVKGHHSVFSEFSRAFIKSKAYSHIRGHWNELKASWNSIFK